MGQDYKHLKIIRINSRKRAEKDRFKLLFFIRPINQIKGTKERYTSETRTVGGTSLCRLLQEHKANRESMTDFDEFREEMRSLLDLFATTTFIVIQFYYVGCVIICLVSNACSSRLCM